MKKIHVLLAAMLLLIIIACGGENAPAPSSAKAITAYSLAGVIGTINETAKTITVTMPYGTDVTALVATFTTTGASVKVGSIIQVWGITANDFSENVLYTVTAVDGSKAIYTVIVAVASSSAKAITAYSINGVAGTTNETAKTIAVTMPYGTDVTALAATFTTTGASVKVGTMTQVSGTTPNNFTSPVTYTVIAADSSTADYMVVVAVAPSPAKAITAFSLAGVDGTINETAKTIAVTMPYGTNRNGLIATFTTTGASVKVGSTLQISGTTTNNFTSPVVYTVTAADNSTANYTVMVDRALSPAKAITAFSLAGVIGTINETAKTIAVTMPYGTDVTALVAIFTTTGADVKVGSTLQISGTTPNNFTWPVVYTVTAADSSTVNYIVTVAVALSPAKAITAFSLAGVVGTINETAKTIAVTMPYGTDVTALVATFSTTGANVKVGSTLQISGTTPNNFTWPVVYTVTAADRTTSDYTVTVAVAPSPAKAITAFSLAGVVGTINETAKAITVTMPYGTDVTALVATFTTTGANVKVGSTLQISGTTPNNFIWPVIYTVTAADSSTTSYAVTVTLTPISVTLSALNLSSGTLQPGFASDTEDYAVRLADVTFPFNITAATSSPYATLTINNQAATSSQPFTINTLSANGDKIVLAVSGDGKTKTYTLHFLPRDFPIISVSTSTNPSPGYIFLNSMLESPYVMILDNHGVPVHYQKIESPNMFGLDFKILSDGVWHAYIYSTEPNGYVTGHFIIDRNFQTITTWNVVNYAGTDFHEFLRKSDGNVIMLGWDYRTVDLSGAGGSTNAIVIDAIIQERNPWGTVVWEWNSKGHLFPEDAAEVIDLTQAPPNAIDYVHANSLMIDNDNNLIVSCRHQNQIIKIRYANGTGDGAVLWRLGGLGSRKNDFTWNRLEDKFSCQHFVHRLDSGNVLLFDNGNLRYLLGDPDVKAWQYSRAVEYALDETNKTVQLVWQYRNPDTSSASGWTYAPCCGSTQRLANGNTLIGWGDSDTRAVVEVTAAGTKVLEMAFPAGIFSYRAFKYTAW